MTTKSRTVVSCALLIACLTATTAATELADGSNNNGLTSTYRNTAQDMADYDPHDDVPSHYSRVRVAHGILMSIVWLFIFPIGGIIPRVNHHPRMIWAHAIMQMTGFWIMMGSAGMGIWMAQEIDQMGSYHPVIGIVLLCLLCVQPATEIVNHRFYQNYPKVIIAAHVHLWLGRILLIAGAVQGGLGLLYAASFPNAIVDAWPRIAYGMVATIVWIIYIGVGVVYPEVRDARRNRGEKRRQRGRTVSANEMENLRANRNMSFSQSPRVDTFQSNFTTPNATAMTQASLV